MATRGSQFAFCARRDRLERMKASLMRDLLRVAERLARLHDTERRGALERPDDRYASENIAKAADSARSSASRRASIRRR